MSFSYSNDLSNDLSKVRFRLGDTVDNGHLLEDEEINAILTDYPNELLASMELCKRILGILARQNDRSAAGVSSSRAQRFDHYTRLLEQLEGSVSNRSEIFIGGASKSANDTLLDNDDLEPPQFAVGMDDHP